MPPFSALRIARYAGLTEMPPHAHDTTTVCLPLRGRYVERTRGRESEHRLGDILLCPAAEEHSQLFPCGRVTKLLMTPTEDMLGFLAESLPLGEAPHGRFAGLGSLAIRLADELAAGDLQSPLIAEGLALQILGQFARATRQGEGSTAWLNAAHEFVRAHAFASVRIRDVAGHVGRSPSSLAAAYRRAYGCTIGEDARALRLERAARLLATTREPIAEIAAECGFYDQAHLTRHFRRAYAVPPLAYRRRVN